MSNAQDTTQFPSMHASAQAPCAPTLTPYLFVVRGDLTRLQADAIVYSTSTRPRESGDLTRAMHAHVPGFTEAWEGALEGEPLELGEVRWLELAESEARLRGVLVAATVERTVTAEAVEAVVRRAIELAWRELAPRIPAARRILVAFPSLGTGTSGTGRQRAIELARVQTRALAEALARPEYQGRVDAVVVAYSKTAYRRFIESRARLRDRFDFLEPPQVIDEARTLVDAIQRRECVLFVGSGLSIGAGLSSWQELVRRLVADVPGVADWLRERELARFPPAARAALPDDWLPSLGLDDFLDLAQWHQQCEHTGKSHQAYIHELFGGHRTTHPPTLAHYLLLSLPFRAIVTTNYDNLIEDTLDALRTPRQRIVTDAEVPLTGDVSALSVVKLHGHAVTEPDHAEALDEAIVLTRDEYDQFFERHPAKAHLLEGLLLNHHFCFYGYSLSDPDLRQIFNRAARMLRNTRRTAWSISPFEASRWSREQWARKGLHQIGFQPHQGRGDELRQLMLWLDGLAERAAERDHTFLEHPEVPPDTADELHAMHALLLELGHTIEVLHERGTQLSPAEVEIVEPVLELLVRLGWQPQKVERAVLWEQLAEAVLHGDDTRDATDTSDAERVRHARRLLHHALGSADRLELLERAKARLAALNSSTTSAEQPEVEHGEHRDGDQQQHDQGDQHDLR